jgi:hypothetical protein
MNNHALQSFGHTQTLGSLDPLFPCVTAFDILIYDDFSHSLNVGQSAILGDSKAG